MNTPTAQRRRDLPNTSITFDVAIGGRCGFTHVATGRVRRLPHQRRCDPRHLVPSATPPAIQCEKHS
jgi:hypothetical protein